MAVKEMIVKVITLKGKGKDVANWVQLWTGVKTIEIDEEAAFDTAGLIDGDSPNAVRVDAVSFVIETAVWLANRDRFLKWFGERMVEWDLSRTNYFENGKKRIVKADGKKK